MVRCSRLMCAVLRLDDTSKACSRLDDEGVRLLFVPSPVISKNARHRRVWPVQPDPDQPLAHRQALKCWLTGEVLLVI